MSPLAPVGGVPVAVIAAGTKDLLQRQSLLVHDVQQLELGVMVPLELDQPLGHRLLSIVGLPDDDLAAYLDDLS